MVLDIVSSNLLNTPQQPHTAASGVIQFAGAPFFPVFLLVGYVESSNVALHGQEPPGN